MLRMLDRGSEILAGFFPVMLVVNGAFELLSLHRPVTPVEHGLNALMFVTAGLGLMRQGKA